MIDVNQKYPAIYYFLKILSSSELFNLKLVNTTDIQSVHFALNICLYLVIGYISVLLRALSYAATITYPEAMHPSITDSQRKKMPH